MIHSVFFAAATDAADASQYLAPGGVLGVVIAIASFGLKEWRTGKQISVADEKRKREAAEIERDEVKKDRDGDIASMKAEIVSLREEISTMRKQLEKDRADHLIQLQDRDDRHAQELQNERNRLLREVTINHRYRLVMAENGVAIPTDLDPAHPEVKPKMPLDEFPALDDDPGDEELNY